MRLWIYAVVGFAIAAYGLWIYALSSPKTPDANRTVVYVMAYPTLLLWALPAKPAWPLVGPVLFVAGLVWLLAVIHLVQVVRDPSKARPGEFLGFPVMVWVWLVCATALLSLYFSA